MKFRYPGVGSLEMPTRFGLRIQRSKKLTHRRCFHDRRHTAATRMADGGADAFALAEIFGWSDVRMAPRYTHATDESKRRAVENLA